MAEIVTKHNIELQLRIVLLDLDGDYDVHTEARQAAAKALGKIATPFAVQTLQELVRDDTEEDCLVVAAAVEALGEAWHYQDS